MTNEPLVSVVTPVYNGEEFLPQCIESVMAQTYRNWDFTIVNNCSTDGSLAISLKYAATDPRIKVVNNTNFLRILENHNRALRCISPEAKYCKVLFADDWLFSNGRQCGTASLCGYRLVVCSGRGAGLVDRFAVLQSCGRRSRDLSAQADLRQGCVWHSHSPANQG